MVGVQSLEPLLEDRAFLIFNKAAGIYSVPAEKAAQQDLWSTLQKNFGQLWIVHRLDVETSGAICFARSSEAHQELSRQFEEREVEKIYHAIVLGKMEQQGGSIDLPISEHPSQRSLMRIDLKKGKESFTEYRLLKSFRTYSLVELKPRTGRTHQLRVHLAASGHPIAVDALYGDDKPIKLSELKSRYKGVEREQALLSRLALHAYSLAFNHPADGSRVNCIAEYSKDFRATLKQLEKNS